MAHLENKPSRGRGTPASILVLASKLFKSFKVVKVILFGLSFGAYAWLYTWQFAAILIGGLVIHEAGHLYAMHRAGMRTRGMWLIPFVGGVAVADQDFPDAKNLAIIALMGPVWGIFSILLITPLVWITMGPSFAAGTAGMLALMNLFNLLPVHPLDGGRAVYAAALSLGTTAGLIFMIVSICCVLYGLYQTHSLAWSAILIIGILELFFKSKKVSIPQMNFTEGSLTILAWLAIATTFVSVLHYSALIPGADIAKHILLHS